MVPITIIHETKAIPGTFLLLTSLLTSSGDRLLLLFRPNSQSEQFKLENSILVCYNSSDSVMPVGHISTKTREYYSLQCPYIHIKIGMWYDCLRESSTKSQATDNNTSSGRHTVSNNEQNPYHKASCKRPQSITSGNIHKRRKST